MYGFFIVGAPKCGTSSLAYYLQQHSDLYLPERKDVPYFGSDLVHTIPEAARTLAEYEARIASAPRGSLSGEASVQYLLSERAADEIRAYNPDARIIIMLRDPVELIYSLHSHNLWMKEEDIADFCSALAAESRRRRGGLIPEGCHFPAGLLYRGIGHLYPHVARFYDVFPPDRIHLIFYEDFRSDTGAAARDAYSFLGVQTDVPLELEVINANKTPRAKFVQEFAQRPHPIAESIFQRLAPRRLHGKVMPRIATINARHVTRPRLDPHLAAELREDFAPDVRKLSELVQRDLSSWAEV